MRQVLLYSFVTANGTRIMGGWIYGAKRPWRIITSPDGLSDIE